jgi:gas vesicle protein
MATAIRLELVLDDKGVVTGVQKLGKEFEKLPKSTGPAFQSISKQQREAHESVQLLNESLGVGLPRGLQKLISQTPAVSGALSKMFAVGAVVAFGTAIVGMVNHFDEVKSSIRDAGFQLALFGDKVRGVFGGDQSIVLGERVRKEQALSKPLLDQIEQFNKAAALTGKVGFGAVEEQRRQALLAIESLKNTQMAQGIHDGTDISQVARDASAARVAAETAADAEILKLRRQLVDETRALQNQVDAIGLKGAALAVQKEKAALDEIRILRQRGAIDQETASRRTVLVEAQSRKEISELIKASLLEERQLYMQANAAEVQGEARIAVETENRVNEQNRLFQEQFGVLAENDARRILAAQILESKITDITRTGELQRQELRRNFARETTQIESEAAVLMLPPWQRANAQIVADFDAAMAELRRQKQMGAIDDGEFASRRAALEHQANARILDEHRQMVQELGSELQSLWDAGGNIGKKILDNAKKLAFQIVAQFLLAFSTKKGGGAAGFGGLLGSLIFGPGSTGAGALGGGGQQGGGGFDLSTIFGGGSGGMIPGGAAGGMGTPPFVGNNFFGGDGGGGGGSSAGTLASLSLGGLTFGDDNHGPMSALAGAAPLIGMLLGKKAGGTLGGIGGTLAGLAISNPEKFGMLGPLAAGLVGFGVGSQHGKLMGTLAGAGTGALTGFMVGGPIGAAIGAIVGAIAGLFGGIFGGKKRKRQANEFVDKSVLPELTKIMAQYKDFQIDYPTALSDITELKNKSEDELRKLKGEGKSVFKKRVGPAFDDARKELDKIQAERVRRSGLKFGPEQFHDGGYVAGGLKQGEVFAKLRVGEFVTNPAATARNRQALESMNNGGAAMPGEMHIHIHAWDAGSVQKWLRNGGAREIKRSLDHDLMEYAG